MASSWLQLANKTAVVTGAASGIGSAVAKALASEHCHVVLADVDVTRLQEVAKACSKLSASEVTTVESNVANEPQVQSLFQNLPSTCSPATVLVNCAGITRDGWIGRMSVDQWQQVQDVNLKGTFLCCREFLAQPELQMPSKTSLDPPNSDALGGSIVNIASVVATQGNLGQVNYAASKGGVLGLTRALAKEVAIRNVNVNAVVPGFIHSPMSHAVPDHVKERMLLQIPQRRFGNPEEVADLVAFLLSQRSSYITGESIKISGMIAL